MTKHTRSGIARSGHDIQYLVMPHDANAPKFYVRGHTPTAAADKARNRLAAMRERFTCGFDLQPIEFK